MSARTQRSNTGTGRDEVTMPDGRVFPAIAGAAEFAQIAEVSGSSVITNWRSRFDDFPHPYGDLSMGPVYLVADIRAFLERHPDLVNGAAQRRVPDETRVAIRRAIADGVAKGAANVAGVAREYGVSRSTVYLMCDDLLF